MDVVAAAEKCKGETVMSELISLLIWSVLILVPLYLVMVLYKPRWVDWAEFTVISALLPLAVSFNVFYLSMVVVTALTAVNITVYRCDSKKQLPLGKDLLRLFLVPAMFILNWGLLFLVGIAGY